MRSFGDVLNFVLCGLFVVIFFTCSITSNTVLDVVQTDERIACFYKQLSSLSHLKEKLRTKSRLLGPFTIFAPTDFAFENLPKEPFLHYGQDSEWDLHLEDFISHHIIQGKVLRAGNIKKEGGNVTALNGESLEVVISSGSDEVSINGIDGSFDKKSEVEVNNGIVHIISSAFLPLSSTQDILQIGLSIPKLSMLFEAIKTQNMENGFLSSSDTDGPFTLLAPTNDAFEKLMEDEEIWNKVDQKTIFASLLKVHVLPGIFPYSQFVDGLNVETLRGEHLTFQVDSDGSTIVTLKDSFSSASLGANQIILEEETTNILAKNGIIHCISNVIFFEQLFLPQTSAPPPPPPPAPPAPATPAPSSPSYKQIGQVIRGKHEGDAVGFSVSLSSDGSIVAVGAPTYGAVDDNSGSVRVFQRQQAREGKKTSWIQLGQELRGQENQKWLGRRVSLSYDGTRLAVSVCYCHDYGCGNQTPCGGAAALVFDLMVGNNGKAGIGSKTETMSKATAEMLRDSPSGSSSFVWILAGGPPGRQERDLSLSLSGDGNTLAVGYSRFCGTGLVEVFRQSNRGKDNPESSLEESALHPISNFSWSRVGDPIVGTDYFGTSVALSKDGENLVSSTAGFIAPGYVRSFVERRMEDGTSQWIQSSAEDAQNTEPRDRLFPQDYFGTSLSLSSDGSRFVVGTPRSKSGSLISVFEFSGEEQKEEEGIIRGSWKQVGKNLQTGIPKTLLFDVAISGDGKRIVHSGYNMNIYEWNGRRWVVRHGLPSCHDLDTSVSMNHNGSVVAVGLSDARGKEGKGEVRIFELAD